MAYADMGIMFNTEYFFFTVVLNDRQRVAKRRLIEENRERRRAEQLRNKVKHDQCYHDCLTDEDSSLIRDIVTAYEQTAVKVTKTYTIVSVPQEIIEKKQQFYKSALCSLIMKLYLRWSSEGENTVSLINISNLFVVWCPPCSDLILNILRSKISRPK